MSAVYTMGVDFGGGGVRCLLLDSRSGQTHHAVRACAPHRTPGTGGLGVDLDLAEIWAALSAATREVVERAGAAPGQIAAIAATSMRLGCVVMDGDGNALLAVPNVDARAAGEGLRMAAEHGQMLFPRTGHWPVPVMAAPRLQWLATQRPDEWKRATHFFSISDWLCWRLSGQALADPSQASVTLLYRLEASDWDWEWIDELGLPRQLFPEMRQSGAPAGTLCAEAARDLGLRAGTPVAVGGADTQCGLLALGTVSHGQVSAIAGSTAPVQAVVSSPVVEPEGRLWTAHHVIPNRWVLESNAGPMGEAVAWLARLLYPSAQEPIAQLFGEAASAEIGAAGQRSTLGTQVMNARAMGLPTGDLTLNPMSSAHDAAPRRHLVRAVSEGLAAGLRANLEQLQATIGSPLQPLVLGGGLARSPSFCETLSEVLGTPLSVSQSPQETARGAALCAGVGAQIWPSLETAAQAAGAPRAVIEPDPERAAASQDVYANWIKSRELRSQAELLASQLATPWVMAANDRAAVDSTTALRPRILVCADFDEVSLRALRDLGEVEYASYRDSMRMLSGASLVDAAATFEVLITEIDLLDADSIARLPRLRLVAACRGDAVNIDLSACSAYGIPVLNAPGRNADAVADLTLGFLLMLARKLPDASQFLRRPGIAPGDMREMGRAFATLQGGELWRKTVGLVGLGAVGREVSKRLAGFGARVLASDPFVSSEQAAVAGATLVSFEELLASSDFVSLHAAVSDATRDLIDADALARMKPGACLVNTARAALTDEDALIAALSSGQLGGLAVDTFSVEPPGSDHPLLSFDNVIATPHVGGNTREVATHQGQMVVEDLARLLAGKPPRALLNPETLADFSWTKPRRQPGREELDSLSGGDSPAVSDLQKGKTRAQI